MNTIKNAFRETLRYPSAIIGSFFVLLMFAVAIYAMVAIPYSEAIRQWRGGEDIWYQNPRFAPPAWFNAFRRDKLPVSFAVRSSDGGMTKTVTQADATTSTIDITYEFDFAYDGYPQEMILYFDSQYNKKQPFASIAWVMPNGEKIRIADTAIERKTTFRIAQDTKLMKRLKVEIADEVMRALFMDPEKGAPLKGRYTLIVNAVTFEPGADVDAEFVFHGQLYGLAGTDQARRDLTLPLLWGTPVALAFGLIASLGTSILTMVIAAVGAWYGGWVDEFIQRITEVNLVLPFLPILIMVGTFFSRSIWVILSVVVLLSIFTGAIKGYRSVFLQVKESGYIEAARAYGASNTRIVFQYLIPRMIPLLIPGLVASVPTFVFLEATLAVLGLGDPVLPTWGKIIEDASSNGALYKGYYYWVLEPAILLMVTGLAFAMLGFALDRIFNPRLREM